MREGEKVWLFQFVLGRVDAEGDWRGLGFSDRLF